MARKLPSAAVQRQQYSRVSSASPRKNRLGGLDEVMAGFGSGGWMRLRQLRHTKRTLERSVR